MVNDPESQDVVFFFFFYIWIISQGQHFECSLFIGENVGLPRVENTVSQAKRVASEFEIPVPPVVLLSFGKSRLMNIAANNNSGSGNKANIY